MNIKSAPEKKIDDKEKQKKNNEQEDKEKQNTNSSFIKFSIDLWSMRLDYWLPFDLQEAVKLQYNKNGDIRQEFTHLGK